MLFSAVFRIFLLSPANSAGKRAQMLLSPRAQFELAGRMRDGGATIGEAFSFLSGLYFRGKMAYAQAFARPPEGTSGALVITTNRGLIPADTRITIAEMRAFAETPIDLAESRYAEAMCGSAAQLAREHGERCEVVLLGSIATGKYVDCLLPLFGERLLFPAEFVGRGDMSRGGLMLRATADRRELDYIPVSGAIRRGSRPARLPPRKPYPCG